MFLKMDDWFVYFFDYNKTKYKITCSEILGIYILKIRLLDEFFCHKELIVTVNDSNFYNRVKMKYFEKREIELKDPKKNEKLDCSIRLVEETSEKVIKGTEDLIKILKFVMKYKSEGKWKRIFF